MAGENSPLMQRVADLEEDREALWREIRALRAALAGAAAMLNSAVPGSS